MDKTEVWRILGIERTKDEAAIKDAYRQKLTENHPEDHPEGFKQLRNAYEAAIQMCKEAEEERDETDPVTQWTDEISEIYRNFDKRRDIDVWRKALESDVCTSLYTVSEVSERLLTFLMDHYRISPEIMSLLSAHFSWEESREDLCQIFPENFVGYIFGIIESGIYFRHDYFEAPPYADIDAYLDIANALRYSVEAEDFDQARQYLDKLDAFDIFHPYVELERIKCLLEEGKIELADEKAESLIHRYPEDFFVQEGKANVLWKQGCKEDAMIYYRKMDQERPDYLLPKLREIEYSVYQKNYHQSKELYYKLLKDYYYECMRTFDYEAVFAPIIDEINKHLIPELEEKLKEGIITEKERIDLGWCYYESDRNKEALSFLFSFYPGDEIRRKYYKLRGIVNYHLEKYEQAIMDLEVWLSETSGEMVTPEFEMDEEGKEKLSHRELERKRRSYQTDVSQIFQMIAFAYNELGEKEDSIKLIQKAIEFNPTDLHLYMNYIYFLSKEKRYPKIIELCNKSMEEYGEEKSLLLQRAIAYYEIEKYPEANLDLERIAEIDDAPIPAVYVKRLQVLTHYGMHEEYRSILEEFKEHFPQEESVRLYEVRYLRLCGNVAEAIGELDELIEEGTQNEGEWKPWEIAAVYYEKYLCICEEIDKKEQWTEAMNCIDRALLKDPDNIEYILRKGYLLEYHQEKQGCSAAESLYRKTLEKFPDQINMLMALGILQYHLGEFEDALGCFKRVMELYPGYQKNAYLYASYILEESYRLDEAVEVMNQKIKLDRKDSDYLVRATFLMEAMRLDEALEDCLHIAEKLPDNAEVYCLLGMIYNLLQEKSLAETNFERSIELLEDHFRGYNPFYHLIRFYMMNKKYKEAIEIAKLAQERFNHPLWAAEKKVEALTILGYFDQAISEVKLQFVYVEDTYQDISLTFALAGVYAAMGDDVKAEKILLEKYSSYRDDVVMITKMANFYRFQLNNLEYSLKAHRKVYELMPEHKQNLIDMYSCIWHLIKKEEERRFSLFSGGRKKKLLQDQEIYLLRIQMLKEKIKKQEHPFTQGCLIAEEAMVSFYSNKIEEAERLALESLKFPACTLCNAYQSPDAYFILGLVEVQRGHRERAVQYISKALDAEPLNRFYQKILKSLN